jgi:hypothetical protein
VRVTCCEILSPDYWLTYVSVHLLLFVVVYRPEELVYEIQLPLVTSPAKIVLDVAEKFASFFVCVCCHRYINGASILPLSLLQEIMFVIFGFVQVGNGFTVQGV